MLSLAPFESAPADKPLWTDVELAHWTIALAIATFLLVAVTVWLTVSDRRRGTRERKEDRERSDELRAEERALSEQRLADERELAEQRLMDERQEIDRRMKEERAAVEQQAKRARQIDNTTSLLQRIAVMDPLLSSVPRVQNPAQGVRPDWGRDSDWIEACKEGVALIKEGALSEALALQDPTATMLYRAYAQLLVDAGKQEWKSALTSDSATQRQMLDRRVELDLRHFSRYVRLLLKQLIDTGEIPADALGALVGQGMPDIPVLGRKPVSSNGWAPRTLPDGWHEDTQLDPHDPQYRPANERF